MYTWVCIACIRQKRGLDLLDLALWMVVSHLNWVLGTNQGICKGNYSLNQ